MARDQNQEGAPQAGWELQWRDREATPDEGYQAYPGANLLEERDRQRRQLGGKLRKIDRDIEASEGYRMRARMNLLEKSYFIFDTNYLNLGHVLDEFEQPAVFLKLWEERTRDRFDLFIDDVIRLFHNYLAGALTLLDHMDTLRDALYGDEGFSEEYQARWEERIGGPALPHFMEDLLVYMLHQGLPFALAELNFGRMGRGGNNGRRCGASRTFWGPPRVQRPRRVRIGRGCRRSSSGRESGRRGWRRTSTANAPRDSGARCSAGKLSNPCGEEN